VGCRAAPLVTASVVNCSPCFDTPPCASVLFPLHAGHRHARKPHHAPLTPGRCCGRRWPRRTPWQRQRPRRPCETTGPMPPTRTTLGVSPTCPASAAPTSVTCRELLRTAIVSQGDGVAVVFFGASSDGEGGIAQDGWQLIRCVDRSCDRMIVATAIIAQGFLAGEQGLWGAAEIVFASKRL